MHFRFVVVVYHVTIIENNGNMHIADPLTLLTSLPYFRTTQLLPQPLPWVVAAIQSFVLNHAKISI